MIVHLVLQNESSSRYILLISSINKSAFVLDFPYLDISMNVNNPFKSFKIMQKNTIVFLLLSVVLFLNLSCKAHYLYENSKYGGGKLSSTESSDLQNFLGGNSSNTVRDTIIINYNYNNANCWQMLDQESDEYILQFVESSKEYVIKNTKDRSKTSYFQYREPGENVNKKILWDESITIDDSLFLKNLLFKNKKSCGNSAIVLPNGDYIVVKDDSHSEALLYDKKKVSQILLKLKNSNRLVNKYKT